MTLLELENALRERGLRGIQVSLGLSAVRKDQWFANAAEKQAYGDSLVEAVAGLLDQIGVLGTFHEQPKKPRRGADLI